MWKLKINKDKSKVVIFWNGRMPKTDFVLNGEKLKKVKEFNYFGILIFIITGSFHKTIKKMLRKVQKQYMKFYEKEDYIIYVLISCIVDLFDNIVKPILL